MGARPIALRCDLLSKVSTFGIWNNHGSTCRTGWGVVTCSQKLVPLVSGTTSEAASVEVDLL